MRMCQVRDGSRVNDIERARELLTGDRRTVNADALNGLYQVRGSIESRADARGAQSPFDHGAGGTLAVGAGDVNGPEGLLWIAEPVKQSADAIESQLGGLHLIAKGVQVANGFLVRHVRATGTLSCCAGTPNNPAVQSASYRQRPSPRKRSQMKRQAVGLRTERWQRSK